VADPECTPDVGKRDGCHLVVKLGRHRSEENATKAKKWLDIHGYDNAFSIGRDCNDLAARSVCRRR
jgi:hypothetical protein